MKTKILFAGLIVLAFSVASSYALDFSDVVGIWLFDEGSGTAIMDSSGNGLNGEILGDVAWVAGMNGTALDFGGIDGAHCLIPMKDAAKLSMFTITAWVKVEPRAAGRASHWHVVMVQQGGSGARNYSLMIVSPSNQANAGFSTGGAYPGATGATVVADGTWHHIAGAYDETNGFKVYVDGVLDMEAAAAGVLTADDGPIYIGNNSALTRAIQGTIDEIGLFSTVLTEDDVKLVMMAVSSGIITAVKPADKLTGTWGSVKALH